MSRESQDVLLPIITFAVTAVVLMMFPSWILALMVCGLIFGMTQPPNR